MENNIVSFIMENILIFLILGSLGIGITIFLFFTGKKDGMEHIDNLDIDTVKVFNYSFNIHILVYLFIFIMMIIIGIFSDFLIPTIVGAIIAAVPIILLFLIIYKTKGKKA